MDWEKTGLSFLPETMIHEKISVTFAIAASRIKGEEKVKSSCVLSFPLSDSTTDLFSFSHSFLFQRQSDIMQGRKKEYTVCEAKAKSVKIEKGSPLDRKKDQGRKRIT